MSTRNSRHEVPTWIAGLILAFVVASAAYVTVYGGSPLDPALVLFSVVGLSVSAFTLYLAYRFVVAVETIAEKH